MSVAVLSPVVLDEGCGEAQLDRDNPWPGLAAYDETARAFFCGRATEAGDLLRRIVDEPMTVLFGKSGLGKTSLLHAGVFPGLRARDLLPVVIRLQLGRQAPPLMEQVYQRLIDELGRHQIEHSTRAIGDSLWTYLHKPGQEFWTARNRLVRPVFVFDQFEELFTLGCATPAAVDAFREDLSDLVENRIPAAMAHGTVGSVADESLVDPRSMPYKVVIALREDFLADLESWRATMPSLRRNRVRLLPMGAEQAFAAVYNEHTDHLVSAPLARTIVTFLSARVAGKDPDDSDNGGGVGVEPALLSLFCRGINENRKRDGKAVFDQDLLEGGKETIVRDFYRSSLADQPARVRRFIEDHLITESGYRNSYAVQDALDNKVITASELQILINRHVLRNEHYLGAIRVELTHDLLTKAVLDERDRRRQLERLARDRRQRWKLIGMAAACAAFGALAIRESSARDEAERLRKEAVEESRRADDARLVADREKDTAEGERTKAVRAKKEADTARKIAADQAAVANALRRVSQSKELAAYAEAEKNAHPERAILLALAGLEHDDNAETRSALIEAARHAWPYDVIVDTQLEGRPSAIALSPDGTRLVVLADQHVLSLWDVTSRKARRVWARRPDLLQVSASVAFSPDQKWIAVGRRTSIDLLDVNDGHVAISLPQPSNEAERRIAFSPDGRWLASTQGPRQLRLQDYRDQSVAAVDVTTEHEFGGFAVLRGGKSLIVVGYPLAAYSLTENNGKWTERPLDVSRCMNPESVSPGSEYFSATWRARGCIFDATKNQRIIEGQKDRVTSDIIWSTGGNAFAELLARGGETQDLVVGSLVGSRRLESVIKGAHPTRENEKSRFISVSESGTRLALIDEGDGRRRAVRVYSVGEHKPFLSHFERGGLAIAPTARWMAVAKPAGDADSVIVQVIPLDQPKTRDELWTLGVQIRVDQFPSRMHASPDSVIVVLPQPQRTAVFDARSGEPVIAAQPGAAEPLGSGELLLFGGARQGRVIKTRDGLTVLQWEASSGADGVLQVAISPARQAFAVLRRSPTNAAQMSATVYTVRGERLAVAGQALNLPRGIPGARLWVADDGRTVTVAQPSAVVSPLGRFELLRVGKDPTLMKVIKRSNRAVVAQLLDKPRHSFSSNDRWLATWGSDALQVLDLARGEVVFRLGNVVEADFVGNDMLNVQFHDGRVRDLDVRIGNLRDPKAMLVPLERSVLESFARWLAPRSLTRQEECRAGLEAEDCWDEAGRPLSTGTPARAAAARHH